MLLLCTRVSDPYGKDEPIPGCQNEQYFHFLGIRTAWYKEINFFEEILELVQENDPIIIRECEPGAIYNPKHALWQMVIYDAMIE